MVASRDKIVVITDIFSQYELELIAPEVLEAKTRANPDDCTNVILQITNKGVQKVKVEYYKTRRGRNKRDMPWER